MEVVKYYLISRSTVAIYDNEARVLRHAKKLEEIGYMVKVLKSVTIILEEPNETFTLIYKT